MERLSNEEEPFELSHLVISRIIGIGRHSRLYQGTYMQNQAVAVKLLKSPDNDDHKAEIIKREFNAESHLLSNLRHPNVIQLVKAWSTPPMFCIITEYMPQGTVRDFLNQQTKSVPMELLLRMALDVARGMRYLHSCKVVHRDLKSENLLLGNDMRIRVADLGVSCLESPTNKMKGVVGTCRWMAPEMLNDKSYTRKVDIYSFGIVLWELLTGNLPFQHLSQEQVIYAVATKNERPSLPSSCPPAFSHLIQKCWLINPNKRPEFEDIVSLLQLYNDLHATDPSSFLQYTPAPQSTAIRCFPICISNHDSASGLVHGYDIS